MGNKENFLKAMLATAVLSSFVCSSTVEAASLNQGFQSIYNDSDSDITPELFADPELFEDIGKHLAENPIDVFVKCSFLVNVSAQSYVDSERSNEMIEILNLYKEMALQAIPGYLQTNSIDDQTLLEIVNNATQDFKNEFESEKESNIFDEGILESVLNAVLPTVSTESINNIKQAAAATKIQSVFRDYRARKEVDVSFDQSIVKSSSCDDSRFINISLSGSDISENELSDDQLQNNSATQIQKVFRGYSVRQNVSATNYLET